MCLVLAGAPYRRRVGLLDARRWRGRPGHLCSVLQAPDPGQGLPSAVGRGQTWGAGPARRPTRRGRAVLRPGRTDGQGDIQVRPVHLRADRVSHRRVCTAGQGRGHGTGYSNPPPPPERRMDPGRRPLASLGCTPGLWAFRRRDTSKSQHPPAATGSWAVGDAWRAYLLNGRPGAVPQPGLRRARARARWARAQRGSEGIWRRVARCPPCSRRVGGII